MTAAAPHNTDLTRDWLAQLYPEPAGWFTLFSHDRISGTRHVRWRSADQLDQLAVDAHALAARSCVWFGVASRRERATRGRGTAADCTSLPGLWLDIDIAGPEHKGGQPLPGTVEEALSLLDAFPLAPTVIVHTGHGLQPYWLFAEPHVVDDDTEALLSRWGHTWDEHARLRGWHVDNVFDLARVLRLPGTHNRKSEPAVPVTLLDADFDRRYGVDDLDQYTIEAPVSPTPAARLPYIGPKRPGDAFNATHTGSDVLARAGFVLGRRERHGDEHWTGPWKQTREGSSATVYADGHTTIWSDSALERWPAVQLRRPYDPFGLYCALFHNGDWPAATAELAQLGYGERAQPDDFSWVELSDDNNQADEAKPPASPPVEPPEWPEPEPIGAPDPDPYPLSVLPTWMADECAVVAERLQVPVDLCAQIVLGAWSAVCMGRIKVRITDTYDTHVNLYLATAMPSGAGKSPADKALGGPLREIAQQVRDDSRHLVSEAKAHRDALIAKRKKLDPERDRADLEKIHFELDSTPLPEPRRMMADDATPEMLTQLLDRHGGRMAIVSTEAALLDVACGAYASNRTVNLDVYLKGWAGERLIVDRKGSGERAGTEIDIPEALLTIAVTVQPSALAALRRNPELFGRGFVARFMFSMPRSTVGRRDRGRLLEMYVSDVDAIYHDRFIELARPLLSWELPVTLHLSPEAARRYVEWEQQAEADLADDGDLEPLREWVAKMQGTIPRVAGLLHVADGRHYQQPIDVDILERAIQLGTYWTSHARSVADLWEIDAITSLAQRILQRFRNEGIEEFTQRDIVGWHRRRLAAIGMDENVEPGEVAYRVVRLLVDRESARVVGGGEVQRSHIGRGQQRYVVNPRLSAHKEQQSVSSARGFLKGSFSSSSLSNSQYPSTSAKSEHRSHTFNNPTPCESEGAVMTEPTGWLYADPNGDNPDTKGQP